MADVSSAARDVYTELVTSFGSSKEPRDLYGTASVSAAGGMVHVDGAPEAVKCHFSVNCLDGDRVMVRVIDHRPVVISNLTNPDLSTAEVISHVKDNPNTGVVQNIVVSDSTLQDIDLHGFLATDGTIENTKISGGSIDGATLTNIPYAAIDELDAKSAEIADARIGQATIKQAQVEDLVADKADITGKLTAAEGDITNLKAKAVEIEGNISAATGRISTLESDNVTVKGRLDAAEADIGELEADNITVNQKITAAEGEITTLKSTKADISVLESDYITAANIEANYAHIDLANVDNAYIDHGVFNTAAIVDEQVFTVTGNKATLDKLDAGRIRVVNLQAKDIQVERINGQAVSGKSIADALVQHESDIAGLQRQVDGQTETWTGDEPPTLENAPASSWKDDAERDRHVGDVYFVTDPESDENGFSYRFCKEFVDPVLLTDEDGEAIVTADGEAIIVSTAVEYSWQLIKDSDVTKALADLSSLGGRVTSIESFDQEVASFKTDTEEELSSLKIRTTSVEGRVSTAEGELAAKVSLSTFNEVKQTVDENSASIRTMGETVASKADGSTVTALSNTVNEVKQTATENSSRISSLGETVASKADGSTVTALTERVASAEQSLSGFRTTVSETYATKEALAGTDSSLASLASRMSSAETAIEQTSTDISLKANSADVYTKTDVDGLMSTEVAARDAAITAKAGEIALSVSETYATKEALAGGVGDAKEHADSAVASAKAEIKATTDGISTEVSRKVGADEVISRINQSAEGVRIQADRVAIDGTAIFESIDGQVGEAIARATEGLAALSYDHTWMLSGRTYTFTGYAALGGKDISKSLEDEFWTWLLRTEDGDRQLPCGRVLVLDAADAGYRASVVGGLLESAELALVDASGVALVDASGAGITAYKTIG